MHAPAAVCLVAGHAASAAGKPHTAVSSVSGKELTGPRADINRNTLPLKPATYA